MLCRLPTIAADLRRASVGPRGGGRYRRAAVVATVAAGVLGFAAVARGAAPPVWVTDATGLTNVTILDSGSDATIGSIDGIVTDGSRRPAAGPDGAFAYLPQVLNGALMRFDTGSLQFSGNATGLGCPGEAAVSPDGSRIYVGSGCTDTNTVRVIDASTYTISASFAVGKGPGAIAIAPDGRTGYVGNEADDTVSVFDTATNSVTATVDVGVGPSGIGISPDGRKVYVANYFSNDVSVISTATDTVIDTVPVGSDPLDVAVTPDGTFALILNQQSGNPNGSVSIVDTATDAVVKTVAVGLGPTNVAITPDGAKAYVVNSGDDTISVLDVAAQSVVKTVGFGHAGQAFPFGVVVLPDQAPVATLSATPAPIGEATSFDASASTVKYGTIVSYAWDFGDGVTAVTSTPTTTHVYTHNGSFVAHVTETDSAGTSTKQVFTGHTMSRNGGPSARATAFVDVPDHTSTAIASSTNPSGKGQTVTYTATVSASLASSGTPSGSIAFEDGGITIPGCASVALVTGQTQCTITYSATGSHMISAVYGGTSLFLPSTSPELGQTVANCGASLGGCNLAGANLTNAQLAGADLAGANLKEAILAGADLAAADLQGTNLMAADLTGADLTGANLQDANLKGVVWSNTTCPDATNSTTDGGTCLGHL